MTDGALAPVPGVSQLDRELLEALQNATLDEIRQVYREMHPMQWATDVAKIALPRSGPLDFEQHPFLREMYADMSPEIVGMKGAQLGFSTWAIIRILFLATTYPVSIVYTMPTRDDISEFTQARINPIILASPYLAERIVDVDSVGQKQFSRIPRTEMQRLQKRGVEIEATRRSTIYFKGAKTERDPTSVDADVLVHDEEDRSTQAIIEEYQSRLSHSAYRRTMRLSTPTRPDFGIDKAWKLSDQRTWMMKCRGCNAEFEMAFPDNVDPPSFDEITERRQPRFRCARCDRTITDRDRIETGHWVTMYEGKSVRGYRVGQMSAPWRTAYDVLKDYNDYVRKAHFFNLVMAQPYQDGEVVFTRESLIARGDASITGLHFEMSRRPITETGCTMGIDVGTKFDVVVGKRLEGRPVTIAWGRLDSWEEVDLWMRDYGVSVAVIDIGPEIHGAKKFSDRWHGRVWRCRYGKPGSEIKWDSEKRIVHVPREETLSASAAELLEQRALPAYDGSDEWEDFIEHHKNAKYVAHLEPGQEKEGTVDYYSWEKDGPDHLFHAGTYEMIARWAIGTPTVLPSVGLMSASRAHTEIRRAFDLSPGAWTRKPELYPLMPGIMKARRRGR